MAVGPARGDVFGRLQIRLKAARPAPALLVGAKIVLRDTAGVRGDITLTTGKDGSALSPLLENRDWRLVRVTLAGGATPPLPVAGEIVAHIAADTTTPLTLTVDAGRGVVEVRDNSLLAVSQTANVYRRDRAFIQKIPATGGNPQSLPRVLRTVPIPPRGQ